MASSKRFKWKVKGKLVTTTTNETGQESCLHQTVIKDMCAECGVDLRSMRLDDECENRVPKASISMVHSVPELIISEQEAIKLATKDQERLLQDRKLVLLVDLDQTIIHTTSDLIPPNLLGVYHFQHFGPNHTMLWYHTKFRPHTQEFLEAMSSLFELHICTFGSRMYAHTVARYLDPDGKFFSHRILSRDEFTNDRIKSGNLQSLFPCGDAMVCIIDDREDVWNFSSNLIHVKPYIFFQGTADINAPLGYKKTDVGKTTIKHRVRKVLRSKNGLVFERSVIGEGGNIEDDAVICGETTVVKSESVIGEEGSLEDGPVVGGELSTVEGEAVIGEQGSLEDGPVVDGERSTVEGEGVIEEQESLEDGPVVGGELSTVEGEAVIGEQGSLDDGPVVDGEQSTVEGEGVIGEQGSLEDGPVVGGEQSTVESEGVIGEQGSLEDGPVVGGELSTVEGEAVIGEQGSLEDGPVVDGELSTVEGEGVIGKQGSLEDGPVVGGELSTVEGEAVIGEQGSLEDGPVVGGELSRGKNEAVIGEERSLEDGCETMLKPKNYDRVRDYALGEYARQDIETVSDSVGECHICDTELGYDNLIGKAELVEDCRKNIDSTVHTEDVRCELESVKKNAGDFGAEGEKRTGVDNRVLLDENKCMEDEMRYQQKTGNGIVDDDQNKCEENKDDLCTEIEWIDEDDYLFYLEDILKKVHKTFYDFLDQDGGRKLPNLKNIIPYIKGKVLKGVNILFSGVVPTHMTVENSRAYAVAKSLGAEIHTKLVKRRDVVERSQCTTHVIAARLGTLKVKQAKREKKLHVITPDWLWACNERWERVDERLYKLVEEDQVVTATEKREISKDERDSEGTVRKSKRRRTHEDDKLLDRIQDETMIGRDENSSMTKGSTCVQDESHVTSDACRSTLQPLESSCFVYDRVTGKRIKQSSFPSQMSKFSRNIETKSNHIVSCTNDAGMSEETNGENNSKEHYYKDYKDNNCAMKTIEKGREEATFAESINPLMMFTENDLSDMDKEVDEMLSNESSSSEEEEVKNQRNLREAVLRGVVESSSDESLDGGTYPRGWGISKRLKSRSCSSIDSPNDGEQEMSEASDAENRPMEIEESESEPQIKQAFTSSDSDNDYMESIGSVDDEIADAVQREFLSNQ